MKKPASQLSWAKEIRKGNAEAFESMFTEYYSTLCRSALPIVRDADVVKDIVHDVFLKIWKDRKKWQPTISLKSYLYKAVRNRALDYQKHNAIKMNTASNLITLYKPVQTPDDHLNEMEFAGAVDKAIAELPGRCQHIFLMSKFDGLKYAEIAEVLDISVKTVETQMGRALKQLRKRLISFMLVLTL